MQISKANCIFCNIVEKVAHSYQLYETANVLAFLDKYPLSNGHVLIIPKKHFMMLHEVDDYSLGEILIVAKKLAKAMNLTNYNLLQNNGRYAGQEVMHCHFHLIPKIVNQGLKISWNPLFITEQQKSQTYHHIISALNLK